MTDKLLLTGALFALCSAGLVVGACGGDSDASSDPRKTIPQATAAELAAANLDEFPLAPNSARVDLVAPTFSNPTRITNPLFPISDLPSAILAGKVDGEDFKTETTLLPYTEFLEGPNGEQVETLISQYVAYQGGRIREVALDHYAQADDGSVWYFGEDVFDFKDGLVASTEGTWFAGIDGPAAMIMPAKPKIGDMYRSENIPGLVFEEVTIKTVEVTVEGPTGPVQGAMIASELHSDGKRENKTFAPGYGEFFTGGGGDVEAMALAVPADKVPGPPPAALEALSAGANDVFDQTRSKEWNAAAVTVRRMNDTWRGFQTGEIPPRLDARMSRALEKLDGAVAAHDPVQAPLAAIAVAQSSLDLQLRNRPPAEIDRARFELWARQLLVDAAADDQDAVTGDLFTLNLIRDRFVHTLDKVDAIRIDNRLLELEAKVFDEDLPGAAAEAAGLRATLAGIGRTS